jgi:diacylglycerol kinase
MKKFLNSADFALQGIRRFFSNERNGQIQAVFGLAAILLGFILSITAFQWLLVLFCIGLVISLEMINSAIEKFCDLVTNDYHPGIKIIKDVAAGSVLVASLFSLITGLVIFIPAIVDFINKLR